MTDNVLAWHYTTKDQTLRYGDGREDKGVGATLTVGCEPEVCKAGLHGSERLLDALKFAQGPMLRRVRLSGDMDHDPDKVAATARTILAEPGNPEEAEYAHRTFARLAAAESLQYWDAPSVVVEYLATGDPALRVAAWAAARGAAWDARAAAGDAAWAAARDAAWAAAWAAGWAAARDAVRAAVRDAVRDAARADLNDLAEDVIPAVLGWDMDAVDGDEE